MFFVQFSFENTRQERGNSYIKSGQGIRHKSTGRQIRQSDKSKEYHGMRVEIDKKKGLVREGVTGNHYHFLIQDVGRYLCKIN